MADTRKYREFGLSVQTALGTKSTAPLWKIVSNGQGVMETVGGSDRSRGSTSRYTVDSAKKVPHYRVSLPVDVYPIAKNGFGPMIAGLGDDTVTTPTGAVKTRKHTIEITEDTYDKFWTLWAKGAQFEQKVYDAVLSKLNISFPRGRATATAEYLGCGTEISSDFSGGSAEYVSSDDRALKLRSSGFFLIFGNIGDKIREKIINASVDFDNGIQPDSGKFHGSLFAHDMEFGDLSITGKLEAIMEDASDLQRAWGGAAPDGSDPILPLTMGEWGPTIEKIVGTAVANSGNTGTVTITSGGNYTGLKTGYIQIECTTAGEQDKIKWRHVYDDGTTGSWHENVNTSTEPISLENGITADFSAVTGMALGDKWTIPFYNYRYGIEIVFNEISMDEPTIGEEGSRSKITVPFEVIATPGSTIGRINIYNMDETPYNEIPE